VFVKYYRNMIDKKMYSLHLEKN